MQTITHEEQQKRWDEEHQKPTVLLQMDSNKPSGGVVKFIECMKERGEGLYDLQGLEICCGKGRNVIWLASQVTKATGIDFSSAAIQEAKKRAEAAGVANKTDFLTLDVTLSYPITAGSLDFAIDCFGSTDIESVEGRKAALDSMVKALKPGGYLMVYLLSTDDEFHKEMIEKNPGPDAGSFIHPVNGKYEKAFTEDEVQQFYGDLDLIVLERIPKKATFFDKEYDCNHIWAVFQKSNQ